MKLSRRALFGAVFGLAGGKPPALISRAEVRDRVLRRIAGYRQLVELGQFTRYRAKAGRP